MLPMNPNWPRWIFASVAKKFTDYFAAQTIFPNLKCFVEGEDRDTNKVPDWLELRVDGPYGKNTDANEWCLVIEINVLISSSRDDRDTQKIHRIVGAVVGIFDSTIVVLRLGDGSQDDGGVEGCLTLRSDGREIVEVSHFGQRESDLPLMQATVEGHYYGYLTATQAS